MHGPHHANCHRPSAPWTSHSDSACAAEKGKAFFPMLLVGVKVSSNGKWQPHPTRYTACKGVQGIAVESMFFAALHCDLLALENCDLGKLAAGEGEIQTPLGGGKGVALNFPHSKAFWEAARTCIATHVDLARHCARALTSKAVKSAVEILSGLGGKPSLFGRLPVATAYKIKKVNYHHQPLSKPFSFALNLFQLQPASFQGQPLPPAVGSFARRWRACHGQSHNTPAP
jgi:hypothetical protein